MNTQNDRANCGTCGTVCKLGEICTAGKCEVSCRNHSECNKGEACDIATGTCVIPYLFLDQNAHDPTKYKLFVAKQETGTGICHVRYGIGYGLHTGKLEGGKTCYFEGYGKEESSTNYKVLYQSNSVDLVWIPHTQLSLKHAKVESGYEDNSNQATTRFHVCRAVVGTAPPSLQAGKELSSKVCCIGWAGIGYCVTSYEVLIVK